MDILESFYYCYRIYPYTTNTVKSLKKEPKLYLWDWSEVRDEGSRFENMIAGHLLKFCHFLRDYEGLDMQLHFVRDKDKRELDFLVCVADKPWFGVEVKTTDTQIASSLRSLKNIVKVPFVYQVLKKPDVDYEDDHNIRVMSANKFLSALI
jgi:predicted AAA+ superfamily ATPase